ncbi:MAG: hypothetical protein Q8P67_02470 [archaeon]|nr:hypothetical protein [archaeon]
MAAGLALLLHWDHSCQTPPTSVEYSLFSFLCVLFFFFLMFFFLFEGGWEEKQKEKREANNPNAPEALSISSGQGMLKEKNAETKKKNK